MTETQMHLGSSLAALNIRHKAVWHCLPLALLHHSFFSLFFSFFFSLPHVYLLDFGSYTRYSLTFIQSTLVPAPRWSTTRHRSHCTSRQGPVNSHNWPIKRVFVESLPLRDYPACPSINRQDSDTPLNLPTLSELAGVWSWQSLKRPSLSRPDQAHFHCTNVH